MLGWGFVPKTRPELAAAAVNMNKVRLAARHPTGYAVLAAIQKGRPHRKGVAQKQT